MSGAPAITPRGRAGRVVAAGAVAALAAVAAVTPGGARAAAALATSPLSGPTAAGGSTIESRAATPEERESARQALRAADAAGTLDLDTASIDVWREATARREGWRFTLTAWTRPTRSPAGVCHAERQRRERASRTGPWTLSQSEPAVWLASGPRCDLDAHRVFLDTPLGDATVSLVLRTDQRLLDRSRALIQGAESCGNAWRCEMELARIAHPWVLGPWRPDDLELRFDGGDCPGASVVLRPLKGDLTPWAAFCVAP